jgi:hypothetical protein
MSKDKNKADELKRKHLKDLYPDGKVSGLRAINRSLYQMIFDISKKKNMTMNDYIVSLGFEVIDNKVIKENNIKNQLLKLYPNKIVSGVAYGNQSLYQRLILKAQAQKISIRQYVENLGFQYKDARYSDKLENFIGRLNELYPDKIVKNFHKDEHSLYIKIFRVAKSEGLTVGDYLHKFDIYYPRGKKASDVVSDKSVQKQLLLLYPDKVVVNLSMNHPNLYQKVTKLSKEKGFKVPTYLNSIGFSYVGSRINKRNVSML